MTTYYLDPDAADDTGTGATDDPWKTIDRAKPYGGGSPEVIAGDTVILRGGYYGQWKWNDMDNTGRDWVTYIAEDADNDKVYFLEIILGSSDGTYEETWIIIDGVRIEWTVPVVGVVGDARELGRALYYNCAGYMQLRNMYINGDAAIRGMRGVGSYDWEGMVLQGRNYSGPEETYIREVEIDSCTFTNLTNGILGTRMGSEHYDPEGTGIWIHNCTFDSFIADAIQIGAIHNSIMEDNTITECEIWAHMAWKTEDVDCLNLIVGETVTQAGVDVTAIVTGIETRDAFYVVWTVSDDFGNFHNTNDITGADSGTVVTPTLKYDPIHGDAIQLYNLSDTVGVQSIVDLDPGVTVTVNANNHSLEAGDSAILTLLGDYNGTHPVISAVANTSFVISAVFTGTDAGTVTWRKDDYCKDVIIRRNTLFSINGQGIFLKEII